MHMPDCAMVSVADSSKAGQVSPSQGKLRQGFAGEVLQREIPAGIFQLWVVAEDEAVEIRPRPLPVDPGIDLFFGQQPFLAKQLPRSPDPLDCWAVGVVAN